MFSQQVFRRIIFAIAALSGALPAAAQVATSGPYWPILLKNSKSQRHQICIRCECNWECRQIIAARTDQRPYIATSTLPSPPSRPSTLRAP